MGRGGFQTRPAATRTGFGLRIGRETNAGLEPHFRFKSPVVEAELLRFAGVHAAVVFGRESTLRNEEVAACVVSRGRVRESDLLEHCRAHLSGWQVPKRVFFVKEIPVNERGKVNRRELASKFRS